MLVLSRGAGLRVQREFTPLCRSCVLGFSAGKDVAGAALKTLPRFGSDSQPPYRRRREAERPVRSRRGAAQACCASRRGAACVRVLEVVELPETSLRDSSDYLITE